MEPGDLAAAGLQHGKAVVLDFPIPEEAGDVAGDIDEIAQEPARQVDQMDALVEHLSAAGDGALPAPFLFHSEPATETIASAEEHQGAEGAFIDEVSGFQNGGMKAVIEADFDHHFC